MQLRIPGEKVSLNRISVSFTWDDNSTRHSTVIAPLFIENGFRCTFYVVAGAKDFESLYCSGYTDLSKKGFEIGSHSFSHKYMASLSLEEVRFEFQESIKEIFRHIGNYPLTFAFPNHDYNELLIKEALRYYLQTRNTLSNTIRCSIKTDTSLETLINAVDGAIINRTNLVFSGHSIIDEADHDNSENGEGYQPMRPVILKNLLSYLKTVTSKTNVITFSQAALREWVKRVATIQGTDWILSAEQIKDLQRFHIKQERIISLL